MPSPFPGMDPWLEDAANWPDVHLQLISVARELLNERLGEGYFARVEDRVYVSDDFDAGREFHVADVKVHPTGANGQPHPIAAASQAIAEPIIATTLLDDEVHEPFIQIIDRRARSVVAVVELLSPSNKRAGSQGLRIYRQKRNEVMRSDSHLVEIDLLREGVRIPVRETISPSNYLVHVSHAAERPKGRLWPIQLPEPLPSIAVPLRGEDADCPLNLQSMLTLAYDRAQYHRDLNYRESPRPLSPKMRIDGPTSGCASSDFGSRAFPNFTCRTRCSSLRSKSTSGIAATPHRPSATLTAFAECWVVRASIGVEWYD